MIIDAHKHFWRVDRGDYFWMDDSVAEIRRDILPDAFEPIAARCGVVGSVVVQAAPTVAETQFLLSLADASAQVQGVVGWVDLTGDVPAQLAKMSHPALRGVRPMLQDIDDTDWVLRDDVVAGLAEVARAGLLFDALIKERHLAVIDRLARAVPDLPIVINHCAKPRFQDGEPYDDWRRGMRALAAHPHVTCKLSGLANEFGPGWSAETLRPVFDHVLECFGPGRLMWGSDWPVLELAGAYDGWLAAAQDLAAPLTQDEQRALFSDTTARVYGLTR
ncbi:MAG: amidohydrolase family protein [Pseudomonadota bacterium]